MPEAATSMSIEELFSSIVEILERRLGVDHDEYEAIAKEIEEVLYEWSGTDAQE